MAVIGGLALAAWKHIRATQDVDLLLAVRRGGVDSILEKLRDAGLRAKRKPPVTHLGQLDVVQLLYEPPEAFVEMQVDLLLADSEYHLTALARRCSVKLPTCDLDIAVLACEDMVLHKLLAGRMIDLADAAALLRLNRESLDNEYLIQWARNLGVAEDLTRLQRASGGGGASSRE